jgi:hypothetical protein
MKSESRWSHYTDLQFYFLYYMYSPIVGFSAVNFESCLFVSKAYAFPNAEFSLWLAMYIHGPLNSGNMLRAIQCYEARCLICNDETSLILSHCQRWHKTPKQFRKLVSCVFTETYITVPAISFCKNVISIATIYPMLWIDFFSKFFKLLIVGVYGKWCIKMYNLKLYI